MWKPSCCNANSNIELKLNRAVELYIKELKSYTNSSGEQKSTYSAGSLVLKKMCYIKDRSVAAQDTSITNGKVDPSTSKELIFKNFPVENFKINEIRWEGMLMTMIGFTKLSTVTIENKRYTAPDGAPFVSIVVGVTRL